ncbi:MAG TPA: PP2C family protein-serine/threonine phosphatase [Acidobacteriaceae bacterium]|nr:PP2C family protein-serine/threonine phosphatase [Acidobacteriaceae bacterium]
MRKPAFILLFVACAIAPMTLRAQSVFASQPVIRYRYGDNPAWAAPGFDDSAWPQARNSALPAPGYESDGFFWVRARIALAADAAGPLAISLRTIDAFPNVEELWVNGRLVGRYGDFPPHPRPLDHPEMLVFDIPAGVVRPGSVAAVALRTWDAPYDRSESLVLRHPAPVNVAFSIGSAPLLHALATEAQDRALLRFGPQLLLALVFIMLGLAVLTLGIWARNRTLLLCALWLVTLPAFLVFGPLLLPGISETREAIAFFILNAIGMWVVVEFLWTVQGFRDRTFRAAFHLCWIGLTIAAMYVGTTMHASTPALVGMYALNWFLFAYNVIGSGADIVALAGRGKNRPVAAAMLLISVGYFLGIAGHPLNFAWLGLNFFALAFYVCTLFIAVLLMRQTWLAWRSGEDLRVEFAAARELQQQLVPAQPPAIAGWRIEATYQPAADVGGDFYQVIDQPGATMLLIGDVSGKGLKAAMTGVLTIGAASALVAECPSPAQLLARLNREMVRLQKDGGFITCFCARIAPDGALTLANAGHLAPYRNGDEIQCDSGLPLGVTPDATYPESTLQLAPGDTLTFLSDGVVEAQSTTGELFGFERTRAISLQSAEEIARAAEVFGQQDDITVLTLTFAPAEVLHA